MDLDFDRAAKKLESEHERRKQLLRLDLSKHNQAVEQKRKKDEELQVSL